MSEPFPWWVWHRAIQLSLLWWINNDFKPQPGEAVSGEVVVTSDKEQEDNG